MRQAKTRQVRNLQKKNAYKSLFKSFEKLTKEGKISEAQQVLPRVFKAVDKAAKTGVIKDNKAARIKSKASRMLVKK